MNGVWWVVCDEWSVMSGEWCVMDGVWWMVCDEWSWGGDAGGGGGGAAGAERKTRTPHSDVGNKKACTMWCVNLCYVPLNFYHSVLFPDLTKPDYVLWLWWSIGLGYPRTFLAVSHMQRVYPWKRNQTPPPSLPRPHPEFQLSPWWPIHRFSAVYGWSHKRIHKPAPISW